MAPLRLSAMVSALRAAAPLFAVIATTAIGLAKSEPCGVGTVNMTITSTEDAVNLSNSLMCTGGGTFRVTWNGTIELSRTIVVGAGSSLNVTGVNPILGRFSSSFAIILGRLFYERELNPAREHREQARNTARGADVGRFLRSQ